MAVYALGITTVKEYVCLEHGGYAGQQAAKWWALDAGISELFNNNLHERTVAHRQHRFRNVFCEGSQSSSQATRQQYCAH